MGVRQLSTGVALALILAACKSVPVAPVVTAPEPPPPVPLDRRASWIVRLEQQRRLHDGYVVPVAAATPGTNVPAPARAPDLFALVRDTDPGVRRRAALAIGRVGRADGVSALAAALHDEDA